MDRVLAASERPMSSGLPLALLSFANFAVGMGAFVVIGVLSPVASDLGISKADAGWLMTAYAIAYALSSPILVAITGGYGRLRVLITGTLLFGAGALAATLAPTFGWLLAARAVMALGGGLVTPVAASISVVLVAPERRGRALAIVFGGLTLAQVFGVPVGAWLGYQFGWRVAFDVVALLAVLAAAALAAGLPRSIAVPRASLALLGNVLADGALVVAISFTALFIGGLYVFYTFLAPLLEARYGLGRDGVTAMLALLGCGAVAGNALGGMLTDRIGPQRTLVLLCLIQLVALPALSLLTPPLLAMGAAITLWSVCSWSFMVAQQARLAVLAPDRVAVVFALNAAAIYFGGSIGSAIGGLVLKRFDFAPLGTAGALLVLVALVSLWAVRPKPAPIAQ